MNIFSFLVLKFILQSHKTFPYEFLVAYKALSALCQEQGLYRSSFFSFPNVILLRCCRLCSPISCHLSLQLWKLPSLPTFSLPCSMSGMNQIANVALLFVPQSRCCFPSGPHLSRFSVGFLGFCLVKLLASSWLVPKYEASASSTLFCKYFLLPRRTIIVSLTWRNFDHPASLQFECQSLSKPHHIPVSFSLLSD